MMPSALASSGLNIEGYPTHKCLMPGKSHDPTLKNNKGIGVLTFKEVAALVDAFKAGTMQVVKSSNMPSKFSFYTLFSSPILINFCSIIDQINRASYHQRGSSFHLGACICLLHVCWSAYRLW